MAVSAGLELGASAVRAVVLERQDARLRVVAAMEVPWGGTSGQELVRAVTQLRKSLGIHTPVLLGLPTSSAIVTTVQPLVVTPHRASLGVRFELQQHLPYEADQAAWHYHWLGTNGHASIAAGRDATDGRAVVAAVKHSLVDERLAACQRAGLIVAGVEVSALAVANAWWQYVGRASSRTGILLHLDGRALEWIVISPRGLSVFPSLLPPAAPTLPVGGGPAETSPSESGGSLIHAGLNQASQEQLIALLKTSWDGLQPSIAELSVGASQGEAAGVPAAVWLVGLSEDYPRLAEDLAQVLGFPVERFDPSRIVLMKSPPPPRAEQLVAACGLALQGLGTARLPINLLDEAMRSRRAVRVRRSAALVGCLSALIAVGWGARGIAASLQARQALLTQLLKQEESYQLLRPEVRTLRKQQSQVEHRLAQLSRLSATHDRVNRALEDIAEALPDSLWLATVELTKEDRIRGTVEGTAQSFQGLTQFMDRVKASSSAWVTVKPQSTNVTTDPDTTVEMVAFSVQMEQLLSEPSAEDAAVTTATPPQGKPPASTKTRAKSSTTKSPPRSSVKPATKGKAP